MSQTMRQRCFKPLRASLMGLMLLSSGAFSAMIAPDRAEAVEFETWLHGTSLMGDVKYPAGFKHFDYVNPDAPKGGTAKMAVQGSYDSFNQVISKGDPASGLGYLYDTLMAPSFDEASADYGLLAEATYVGPDYSFVKFRLRETAKWHDGQPITPEDVVWSFEQQTKLNPQVGFYYSHVTKAEVTGEREITFTFDQTGNRELPHIVGQLLIMPKHWWTGTDANGNPRDIAKGTLEPPLGSGPYKIGDFSAGKYVTFERVDDYWAKDLNVNVGRYNMDEIRIEYFRDDTVMFENFKSGGYDYRVETTAQRWAVQYDFPAVKDGRVVTQLFPDSARGVMVGFIPNLRREKFKDIRVRKALNYVFNFEEMNRTLFYDQYSRISSYFFGTELASKGTAEGRVAEMLTALGDKVPPAAFEPYTNPKVESREDLRDNLKKALELFKQAGWEPRTEVDEEKKPKGFFHSIMVTLGLASDPTKVVMRNDKGEAFEIEYLLNSSGFERVALRLQASLERVGIKLNIRMVDSSQYINRLRSRDYDLIYSGWAQSLSPGNEQREFFGSQSADREGSRNFAGIKNEAVDALIDKIIFATDRADLVAATKAMDRVLLANHYTIPGWTLPADRIARWDKFSHPDPLPMMTVGFPDIWWWDKDKAAAVEAKN